MVRVALAQIASTREPQNNLDAMRAILEDVGQGADLVVFPECSMSIDSLEAIAARAEELDGPFVSGLRAAAATSGVNVVFTMWEKVPGTGARAYNTLVVLGRNGSIVGVYRKVHMYDAFGFTESRFIQPADEIRPLTVDIEGLKFGMAICYDLRFPETSRALADDGADVLLLPSAWMPGPRKEDHWSTLLRARAIENTAYAIGVNQAAAPHQGGSLAVDPDGLVLAQLRSESQVAIVYLDSETIAQARRRNPSLANRRYQVTALA